MIFKQVNFDGIQSPATVSISGTLFLWVLSLMDTLGNNSIMTLKKNKIVSYF